MLFAFLMVLSMWGGVQLKSLEMLTPRYLIGAGGVLIPVCGPSLHCSL